MALSAHGALVMGAQPGVSDRNCFYPMAPPCHPEGPTGRWLTQMASEQQVGELQEKMSRQEN